MKRTAAIVTLGCRVNQYESDVIAEALKSRGFVLVPFGEKTDVTVINTCTVTAESDRKCRQLIRRAVSSSDGSPVVVTGCYVETGREDVEKIGGVTYVAGNARKSHVPDVVEALVGGKSVPADISDVRTAPYDRAILTVPQRTRSYIKIEDGCECRCAYCIIPKARGRVRSKDPADVIREAKALREAGAREVILTGIETASYGRDFGRDDYYGCSLAAVIGEIDGVGFERIGLGSLDPAVMSEKFVARISKVGSLLPHFHLSVQSGSTSVLNRMRRTYNEDMMSRGIERLRAAIPDVTLSADVIVGFPGETDEEFDQTLEFVKKTHFLHLHIFPYSIRQGTEAAEMKDQVPQEIKAKRLHALEEAQKKIKAELLEKYVEDHRNEPVKVLVEKPIGKCLIGHSEHFVEVLFDHADVPDDEKAVGCVVNVLLTGTDGDKCTGVAVRKK